MAVSREYLAGPEAENLHPAFSPHPGPANVELFLASCVPVAGGVSFVVRASPQPTLLGLSHLSAGQKLAPRRIQCPNDRAGCLLLHNRFDARAAMLMARHSPETN